MKNIAEILRDLRDQKCLLLRQVAAKIEIDPGLLSKIERGERLPTKEQVVKLAEFYDESLNEFLVAYLSDKLVYELQNEEFALEAMQVAEQKINYIVNNKK